MRIQANRNNMYCSLKKVENILEFYKTTEEVSLPPGTSTSKEAKEYFSDMGRHRIRFRYGGSGDDESLDMAFSKKKIEERKEWLTNWMREKKARKERGDDEEFLYNKVSLLLLFF